MGHDSPFWLPKQSSKKWLFLIIPQGAINKIYFSIKTCVHNGTFYWEVEYLSIRPGFEGEDANIRVGWSTRKGDLSGPVGCDKYGWGYRDVSGSKVHKGNRDDEYGESFNTGDISFSSNRKIVFSICDFENSCDLVILKNY